MNILPWVYGLEITTCHYKGLLQKYVMIWYGFLNKWSPIAVLRFPAQTSPLAPCGSGRSQCMMPSQSTEHDTQPIAYLISKEAIPYQTRGDTCSPRVSTPKIRSLVDLSTTCHDDINHLYHSNHC
jgi:hypothetical protein